MKIKIDRYGNLHIDRAGQMKRQYCPFVPSNVDGEQPPCGGWCPHFMEPHRSEGFVHLDLCFGTVWSVKIENFTDERKKQDQQQR